MFSVGQKVVCVDASGPPGQHWLGDAPIVGAVYTVRDVVMDDDVPCLFLEEIDNFPFKGCYAARRFRPIVSRKTDISIFTKMLTPKKVDA